MREPCVDHVRTARGRCANVRRQCATGSWPVARVAGAPRRAWGRVAGAQRRKPQSEVRICGRGRLLCRAVDHSISGVAGPLTRALFNFHLRVVHLRAPSRSVPGEARPDLQIRWCHPGGVTPQRAPGARRASPRCAAQCLVGHKKAWNSRLAGSGATPRALRGPRRMRSRVPVRGDARSAHERRLPFCHGGTQASGDPRAARAPPVSSSSALMSRCFGRKGGQARKVDFVRRSR